MLERLCGLMRPSAVVAFAEAPIVASDGRGARSCLSCDTVLSGKYVEAIHVDVCESHGVWFDKDELQTLLYRVSGEAS